MPVNDIINSLNIISENLFKSVEGQVYEVLDKIVLISPEILKQDPLKYIFFENKVNGIMIIANSLIIFHFVYYIFLQLLSMYNGFKTENVYLFTIKIICISLLVNNSYFICDQLLSLGSILSDTVTEFAKSIAKEDITFENLKEIILSIDKFMKSDLLSLDGLIKGIISFGSISILINFSIRYVTVIFLLIISPICLVCFSSNLTIGIAKTWLKMLITSILTQTIVKLIIFIPIVYKDTSDIMYKIILVGSIYTLYKINDFINQIFIKISNDDIKNNLFNGG